MTVAYCFIVPGKLVVTRQESISVFKSESNKSLSAQYKGWPPQVQNDFTAPFIVWRMDPAERSQGRDLQGLFASGFRWPQIKDGIVFKPVSPQTLTEKEWDPGKCKRWNLIASSSNPQSSETMIYMNCVHHNSTQLTHKAHWHGIQLMFRKRIFESRFISVGLK